MIQNDLKAHLLQNTTRLTQAATNIQLDSSLFYDAIYLAVIKTRQKYKKLVNKNRAVDVCISLMKQPRKHVKQSFESVEDCIEKAMAAKIVPWKPILSAAAVVLVAAIILPFCLPKKPVTIDPKGFVMEGTQVLANRLEGNDVQLKNFHKISDLGAANIRELANTELNADGTDVGDAQYRIHTTSNGITFLVQVYVNADTKKSEFILYKGETNGWHEVGRDTVKYQVDSARVDGVWKTIFRADPTLSLFSDPSGNLYILSCYDEGLQIHLFDTNDEFRMLDQIWLLEHKQVSSESGYNMQTAKIDFSFSYNPANEVVSIMCLCETSFLTFDMRFVAFDLNKKSFSIPKSTDQDITTFENITAIAPTDNGEFYFLSSEDTIHSATSWDSYYYIYHCDSSGNIINKIPYGERIKNSQNLVDNYLLEVRDGNLHFVYRKGAITYYSIYQNGVEISKTRVYAITTDSFDYMAFFFHDNDLYYMVEIDNKYISIVKTLESNVEKVAEFEMPFTFDEFSFLSSRGVREPHFVVANGVLNYIIGEYDRANYHWEYVSSYFFQIVLE